MKFKKNQIPWNKGIKCSDETREKIGKANKGKPAWNKNIKCPEETKRKISLANKGNIPWNKGIPASDELKKKYSEAHKGQIAWNKGTKGISGAPKPESFKEYRRKKWSGENNPNWRGGTSEEEKIIKNSSKWRNWRKSVFERDNYTCQMCGIKTGLGYRVFLHPHHIKPFSDYPELRFDVNNGITLCRECHRKTDNYGSKLVNTKKSLKNLGELLGRPYQI